MLGKLPQHLKAASIAVVLVCAPAMAHQSNHEMELRLRPMYAANLIEGGTFPGSAKVLGGNILYDTSNPANAYLSPIGGTWIGSAGEVRHASDSEKFDRCKHTNLGLNTIPLAEVSERYLYCFRTGTGGLGYFRVLGRHHHHASEKPLKIRFRSW